MWLAFLVLKEVLHQEDAFIFWEWHEDVPFSILHPTQASTYDKVVTNGTGWLNAHDIKRKETETHEATKMW